VHNYAKAVTSPPGQPGHIVAGRYVVAACQRHLDDLAHAHERGIVWLPPRAEGGINFFEKTLHLSKDTPFLLEDFQAFCVGSLLGWWMLDPELDIDLTPEIQDLLRRVTAGELPPELIDKTKFAGVKPDASVLIRRFTIFYGEMGKGNGKTPLAAGLGLMFLEMGFDPKPECYSAAADKAQARICFTDADQMVEASPLLKHIQRLTHSLTIPGRHATFLPLSSEDKGKHGKRVSFAALDEIHAHGSGKMVRAMVAGTKNCRNALIVLITNSGHDRRSICWQYHEAARKMLERHATDDRLFAYVCTLDPCKRCLGLGRPQPDPKCKKCDSLFNPATWIKANPGLGTICRRSYVAQRVELARTMPSELNDVLQLNGCQWVESAGGWANMYQWDNACAEPDLKIEAFSGRRAVLAMDAANRVDVTSLVAVVERDPGAGLLDPTTLDKAAKEALAQSIARQVADAGGQRTEDGGQATDNGQPAELPAVRALSAAGYAVFDFHFVPRAMVENQNAENHAIYQEWEASGELIVTEGAVTDFAAIMEKIRELGELLNVVRFQYDPRELGYFAQQLQAQEWAGFEIVEVTQSPAMISQPMKELEALIASGLVKHSGNRVLRWMMANVVQKHTKAGPVKFYFPTRASDALKIDGAVSLIMGLDGILRGAAPEPAPGMIMLG
jgi:phage terminase large subunit-like protein